VDGLTAELTAANARLATYHTQLGLIRNSVSAVVDQVASLNDLVQQADPLAPPPSPAPVEPPADH
jgi:hypothetical protein